MTSIGHIITSLLPHSDCRPLTLVVTVDVQSGGGHSNWPSTEVLLNPEEKTIQVISSIQALYVASLHLKLVPRLLQQLYHHAYTNVCPM